MVQLETYHRKRNFDVTDEPRGKPGKSGGHSFVVQKHAARRLHYDFRLELDGVLKSWAVAKGPSLVPGEKRLAVEVEDHPLDYGSFKGTIPAGQYGAGAVLVWDRGTWTSKGDPHEGLKKGQLDFTLDGDKLKGAWHLVRMRGKPGDKHDNWLLIKSDDAAARSADDADILDDEPRSVLTQRSIEEIAGDAASRQWTSGRSAAPPTAGGGKSPRARAAAPLVAATRKVVRSPRRRRPNPSASSNCPCRRAPARRNFPPLSRRNRHPRRQAAARPILALRGQARRLPHRGAPRAGPSGAATRNGLDWTQRFAALAAAVAALPVGSAILDGESSPRMPRGSAISASCRSG